MFVDSAYWNNSRRDIKDRKHPLFVTSCGNYRLIHRAKLPTHRPRGRLDFQLLYIAAGKAHFYFQGKEQIVTAGNMVLYRPKEEQRYYYYGVDHTEVFWVHFTGRDVTNILRRYGLGKEHIIHTGINPEYRRLFQVMIRELRECRTDYEEALVLSFRMLLIHLHRLEPGKRGVRSAHLAEGMEQAVQFFSRNYASLIGIEEYALEQGMSVSWFIRSFREYTGYTPAQYLLSLRISAAQTLLEQSDMNIGEVAALVGYDNPFYFSRIFRKQCGISPREFRQQLQATGEGENVEELQGYV